MTVAAPATAAAEPAKPAAPPKPDMTLVASVDLAAQRLTVVENGKTLHQWKISSGVREFPTPVGNFRAEWTAKMWYSKQYDDAPMPHAVFFKNGAAIHATQSTGALGRPASHGCVRLAPENAATFYKLVQRHGVAHTKVTVFGSPKFAPVAIARASEPGIRQPRNTMIYRGSANSSPFAGGYAQYSGKVWPGDRPSAGYRGY